MNKATKISNLSYSISCHVSAVSRTCYEDHHFGKLKIPKGMQIMINMKDLHFNPDLWTTHDPKEFHPER